MPQTCGGVSRADSGAPGMSDAESVIAMVVYSEERGVGRELALSGSPSSRRSPGRQLTCGWLPQYQLFQPATSLMRAISSSTAFSTGTFSLTTRFIALAQTFSLLRIVNFQFLVKSNGVVPPVNWLYTALRCRSACHHGLCWLAVVTGNQRPSAPSM